MKKVLLALGVLAAVAMVAPSPARADFSLSIGLPGFGLFIQDPLPPPPVYFAPPYPRPYYRAPRPYYYPRYYHRGYGPRYGYNRRYRGCD